MPESYPTVTVEEAREILPDLLRRIACGEHIVIEEGGKWVAMLGPAPPPPPPSEEEVQSEKLRRDVVRGMLEAMMMQKPLLEDGTRIQDILDDWDRQG